MHRLSRVAGAFLLASLAAPLSASALMTQDPPGSDRAGKLDRVDTPPPDPTPAPAARPLAGQPEDSAVVVAPARGRATPPPVVGSQQIDRYDAIAKLQKSVEANPKALADWVILGELAHEVAMDAPADQAARYFKLSRDAFEKAQALAPNNPGLKAAVQFAKDQASHVDEFEKSRDAMTDTFLDARRRDLAAAGNIPSVRTFATPPLPDRTLPGNPVPPAAPATDPAAPRTSTPAVAAASTISGNPAAARPNDRAINSAVPLTGGRDTPIAEASPAITPAPTNAPATDAANYGTRQDYSRRPSYTGYPYGGGPIYQPFATPDGPPYTYQQYSSSYFPPGLYNNPAVPPVTIQRLTPAVSPVVPNALERQILNRTVPR